MDTQAMMYKTLHRK